jgi:hypothetical protein
MAEWCAIKNSKKTSTFGKPSPPPLYTLHPPSPAPLRCPRRDFDSHPHPNPAWGSCAYLTISPNLKSKTTPSFVHSPRARIPARICAVGWDNRKVSKLSDLIPSIARTREAQTGHQGTAEVASRTPLLPSPAGLGTEAQPWGTRVRVGSMQKPPPTGGSAPRSRPWQALPW